MTRRLKRPRLLQIGIFLSLVSCLSIGAQFAAAAPPPTQSKPSGPVSPDKQVDALFKEWDTLNTPGASVAVIQHGKVIFAKGYGIANLEYNIPIKPETIFHVASVSKQFTAMAVVLLESDGKLALDDDVHQYLPELPDYGNKITIRHLLQHTSGIRDQWQLLGLAGWNLQDVITQDQALRLIFRQKELNFAPGTHNLYSNSGFTLLAEIVTRVAGMPFPQFCAERIFTPLKMTRTHFHQDLTQLVPGRAYSYENKGAGFAAAPMNYAIVGATSLFTTASDLVLWLDNFRDPRVGGAAAVARMQEEGVLSDGTKIHYGLGVALGTYRGLKTISHGGGDAGYRSQVIWFPEQELGVAVISNLGSFNPGNLSGSVAEVYIGDKMAPQEAKQNGVEPKYVPMDVQELEKFAGVYPLPKVGQTLTVVVKDGKLWAAAGQQLELHPVGPGHFYCKEIQADMEFSPQEHGGMHVKITQPGGAINESERIPAAAGAVDLLPYAGVYWSDELETQYTFFVRDGSLYARHAHHGEVVLAPIAKDEFSTGWWFTPNVKFVRDAAGNISGVTLGGGRVAAVAFTRKPGPAIQEVARRKFEKH
ncbi:MAG TPA: serine hydrolase domain-containing protein [Steroidobacteraceae bacterium]|nr:serine hydrolase domain-containing protein [Steroidobacteraceae bacterium]